MSEYIETATIDELKRGATSSRSNEEETRHSGFLHWISCQSLPRLLGLLVGNTRELEHALTKAETEIFRVRSEVEKREEWWTARDNWWAERYRELSDSVLLNKGMLPTSQESRVSVSTKSERVESRNSPRQLELEAEADKLVEMLQRGDLVSLQERIEDMLSSNRPQDKRILAVFNRRERELEEFERNADIGQGVVIGVPEAAELERVS